MPIYLLYNSVCSKNTRYVLKSEIPPKIVDPRNQVDKVEGGVVMR